MNFEDITELLTEKFGADVIEAAELPGLQPALHIKPALITAVCKELRDNANTYFDFLACLSGVDYGVEESKFGVVYHLTSIPFKTSVTLKVSKKHGRSNDSLPSFLSVSSVWRAADWYEREAYDLLGISFENHPDLRRILLPDDWVGHPLRRDYVNLEYYKGIKVDT